MYQRDATTLLSIIQQHVRPGTIVHSHEWRVYNRVATLPAVVGHRKVNHFINFVDPATGVHTQHIESYWNRVKYKLEKMKGCHRHVLPSYSDKFMWRDQHGNTHTAAFLSIIQHISQWYPVP